MYNGIGKSFLLTIIIALMERRRKDEKIVF